MIINEVKRATAITALEALKEPIDTFTDSEYMSQCLVNGEINILINRLHGLGTDIKFGCHCDLEPSDVPCECVCDDPDYTTNDCIFAEEGMDKTKCPDWKAYKTSDFPSRKKD